MGVILPVILFGAIWTDIYCSTSIWVIFSLVVGFKNGFELDLERRQRDWEAQMVLFQHHLHSTFFISEVLKFNILDFRCSKVQHFAFSDALASLALIIVTH